MECVVCDQGELRKIYFKKDQSLAFLCEECGAIWLEGSDISSPTPLTIHALTLDDEMEYLFVDMEDSDKKSIMYPKYK